MAEQKKLQPLKEFRSGRVSATVWENEGQSKGERFVSHSVQIQKRYQDRDGQWRNTTAFFVNELPKVLLLVQKAYEFIVLSERGDEPEQGE